MTLLILGVALWVGAHLFKRLGTGSARGWASRARDWSRSF